MTYQHVSCIFETAAKVCAVVLIFVIIISVFPAVLMFNLAILLSLAAGNYREKLRLIFSNPITLPFVIFFCLFLFGTLYSTASVSDILIDLRKHSKFLLGLMFIPLFVEEKWRSYAISSFMAAAFAMLLCSYLTFFECFKGLLVDGGMVEVFKIAMEFNGIMSLMSYFCLMRIFNCFTRYRFLWIIFLVFLTHTILFRSIGRTGFVVFFALWMLFFYQKYKWKGCIVGIISLSMLGILSIIYPYTFSQRSRVAVKEIEEYVSLEDINSGGGVKANENIETYFHKIGSSGIRLHFVRNALILIKAYPIFGSGTGSYSKEYSSLNLTLFERKLFPRPNPHNEYIYIGVQFGILGLVVLILFFYMPLYYSKFLPEREKYIVRAVIVTVIIGSLANNWLTVMVYRYMYVYFVPLAFAAFPIRKERQSLRKVFGC
ncbi:MAG: O-antigen ligase family protein [Coxiellaceae bacterium]|jgi:O-antigen ligase|nr:O-antigen ligase family protein [Coxiellaceae bacterium]